MGRMFCLITLLVFVTGGRAEAASVVLDFDSVTLASGDCTDASGYLATFGVAFSPVSSGASGVICNVTGSAITPASGVNVFFGIPPVTNTNVSYDLLFSTPLTTWSVTRAGVASATSMPGWAASAYDASDTLLDSLVEPSLFPGPPAAPFTLSGPGITRVRVDAFNAAARTYNHPPFDDMILTTVPEPSLLMLLAPGAVAACSRRRRGVTSSR